MTNYKIGDLVEYDGLIGKIIDITKDMSGKPLYSLESIEDDELTCSASEDKLMTYKGSEVDQSKRLFEVKASSQRTLNMIDSLTDKNFRDGCH